MAEGGYDPTETIPPFPETGDNNDDDDDNFNWDLPSPPDDPDTTGPFTPGASSTPAGGESIPMTERTRLPKERGSRIDETSFGGEPTERTAWAEIEGEFPLADKNKLKSRYKTAPRSGGAVLEVSMRAKDKWYPLYTKSLGDTEKTFNTSIPKEIQKALGKLRTDQGPGDAAMRAFKNLFPDAKDVEAYLNKTTKQLMIKKPGADQPSYPLYTTEANPNNQRFNSQRLNPEIPPDLRAALGESAVGSSNNASTRKRRKPARDSSKKERTGSTGGNSSEGARDTTRNGRPAQPNKTAR